MKNGEHLVRRHEDSGDEDASTISPKTRQDKQKNRTSSAKTRPQLRPAHSWSLHPPTAAPAPPTVEEPERKPPKGVALQFDINSVGKQTAITLNERFRILKDKRIAAAKQSSKGGRFVTVG